MDKTNKSIEKVLDEAEATRWQRPIEDDCLISHLVVSVFFTAKNGKKYLAHLAASAVITRKELYVNKPESLDALKGYKLGDAKRAMRCLIKGSLSRRMGLRGHRGCFSFQDISPAQIKPPSCGCCS